MERMLQWMATRRWLRAAEVVAGAASVKVAAGAGQKISPAEVAAGAPSVEVAADAYPAKNQDPEADVGPNDNVSLAPIDPVAPPMSVGQLQQPNEPTEAERLAHNLTHIDWCESCVRGRNRDHPHRGRQDQDEGCPSIVVQGDYFFFKAVKEDIMCKAIGAIDSVYNRTMALECEFKSLSGEVGGR